MITAVRLRDFKNFADATLRLGSFSVIIGTNASGKSNVRDAFRFLHGVGRGYRLLEIVGGRYGVGSQLEWAEIRGALNEIYRFGHDRFEIEVSLRLQDERKPNPVEHDLVWRIVVGSSSQPFTRHFMRIGESLIVDGEELFSSIDAPDASVSTPDGTLGNTYFRVQPSNRSKATTIQVTNEMPAIGSFAALHDKGSDVQYWSDRVMLTFASIRFFDLHPERMRNPSVPGLTVLGDSGENLPSVLERICRDEARKATLLDWVRELTPIDVVDLEFPTDPSGHIQLALRQNDRGLVSAYSASDGTLRFLAILATMLGEDMPALYFFEEPETGIHPTRLKVLIDLLEARTAKGKTQVVTTTHSPALIDLISDRTFQSVSVIFRTNDSDHAIIKKIAELPDAKRLRKKNGLGHLHASHWFEDILTFTSDDETSGGR